MDHFNDYWDEDPYGTQPDPPGLVKRFFFACAGAYIKILEVAPSEHAKYVGIGATVFLTGCLAVLSGTFAMLTLVESAWVALGAGLLWGALIFNLDRYIVSSIRKEGRIWHELGLALPRIILAIIISLVITKPIEVELFGNQINSELYAYVADLEREAEMTVDTKLGIDSLNLAIARVDSQRQAYKRAKEGRPTSFTFDQISREYQVAKRYYDSLTQTYRPRMEANEARRRALWEQHATRRYTTDASGNRQAAGWDFPQQYRDQNNRLYQINQELKQELAVAERDLNRLDRERTEASANFSQGVEEELALLQTTREELMAQRQAKMVLREAEVPAAIEKARKYGVGFPAKIQALERLKQKDSSMWWMSNLIVLLFILLETSPIFVKLITKRGPYDYLLSKIEHRKKVESLRYISDLNHDLNVAMQMRARRLGNGMPNGSTASPESVISEN